MHQVSNAVLIKTLLVVVGGSLLVACAGQPQSGRQDMLCRQGIERAYDELSLARSQGFSGTVGWSKAASLLAAAKLVEQVEQYDQCLENVDKARFYIRQSQGG